MAVISWIKETLEAKKLGISLEEYRLRKKAIAEGISVEHYRIFVERYESAYSLQQYKEYLSSKQWNGFTFDQYMNYQREFRSKYTPVEYHAYVRAREHGLSIKHCHEYAKNYRTSYNVNSFKELVYAFGLGLTEQQYTAWSDSYRNTYTLERYADVCAAKKQGSTLEEFDEKREAQKRNLSISQYREFLKAKELDLSLKEYSSYQKLIKTRTTTDEVTIYSSHEIKAADRAGFRKVILDKKIHIVEAEAFSDCTNIEEVQLGWGIQELHPNSFSRFHSLKKVIVPGSIKKLTKNLFRDCRNLEEILLMTGIESVDITGWENFPRLKCIQSSPSIKEFKYDYTNKKCFVCGKLPDTFDRHDRWNGYIGEPYYERLGITNSVQNSIEVLIVTDECSWRRVELHNFPNLKVIILNGKNGNYLDAVINCPKLQVAIIQWWSWSSNTSHSYLYAHLSNQKYINSSFQEIQTPIRFMLILDGADSCAVESSYANLCWLHLPFSVQRLSIFNGHNLKGVALSNKCSLSASMQHIYWCDEQIKDEPPFWLDSHVYDSYSSTNGDNKKLSCYHGTTVIKEGCFQNANFEEVYLPESITAIQEKAFSGCEKLKHLSVNHMPNFIHPSAFEGINVSELKVNVPREIKLDFLVRAGLLGVSKEEITEIKLEDTHEILAGYASKTNAEKVEIPKNVKQIRAEAFSDSPKLKNIVVQGDPEIEDNAFRDCQAVEEVVVNLSKINCIAGIGGFPNVKHIQLSEKTHTLGISCFENWGITSITIPADVKLIMSRAFANTPLESITILGNPEIAGDAFEGCTLVKELNYTPTKWKRIAGKEGFPLVKQINIASKTKSLGSLCFENWGLTEVCLPASLETVGKRAFAGNPLKRIIIAGNPQIASDAFEDCTSVTDVEWKTQKLQALSGKTGFPRVKRFEIAEYVEVIPDGMFYKWGIESVVLPDKLKELGKYAFKECLKLNQINGLPQGEFPLEMPNIVGEGAFEKCKGFSLLRYCESAFEKQWNIIKDCKISKVIIPAVISKEHYIKLLKEPSLTEIVTEDDVSQLPLVDGAAVLPSCSHKLEKLYIPQCIGTVSGDSLAKCDGLLELQIAPSVYDVKNDAFINCKKLRQICCHDQLQLPIAPRKGRYGLKINKYGKSNDELEYGIVEHEQGKLTAALKAKKNRIRKLVVSSKCSAISDKAFEKMSNLEEVLFEGEPTVIGKRAFANCCKLKSIQLPESVKTLGEGCFSECVALKQFKGSPKITTLPVEVFSGCTSLQIVEGLSGVSRVEEKAFEDCAALQSIAFSEEIFSIVDPFQGCTAMEEIFVPVDIAVFRANLESCASLKRLYLPMKIDEFACQTATDNKISLYVYRGSAWRKNINVNQSIYLKKNEYEDIIREKMTEVGYAMQQVATSKTDINAVSAPTPKRKGNISQQNYRRAAWRMASDETEIQETFSNGPSTVEELLDSLEVDNNTIEYSEKVIDTAPNCIFLPDGPLAECSFVLNGAPLTVSNTIFSVCYQKIGTIKNANGVYSMVVDQMGRICSEVKHSCFSQKLSELKLQFQLKPSTPNGTYYIILADRLDDVPHYYALDQVTVDVAFAVDSEFFF